MTGNVLEEAEIVQGVWGQSSVLRCHVDSEPMAKNRQRSVWIGVVAVLVLLLLPSHLELVNVFLHTFKREIPVLILIAVSFFYRLVKACLLLGLDTSQLILNS